MDKSHICPTIPTISLLFLNTFLPKDALLEFRLNWHCEGTYRAMANQWFETIQPVVAVDKFPAFTSKHNTWTFYGDHQLNSCYVSDITTPLPLHSIEEEPTLATTEEKMRKMRRRTKLRWTRRRIGGGTRAERRRCRWGSEGRSRRRTRSQPCSTGTTCWRACSRETLSWRRSEREVERRWKNWGEQKASRSFTARKAILCASLSTHKYSLSQGLKIDFLCFTCLCSATLWHCMVKLQGGGRRV